MSERTVASRASPKDHKDNLPIDETVQNESDETGNHLTGSQVPMTAVTTGAGFRAIIEGLHLIVMGFQLLECEHNGSFSE